MYMYVLICLWTLWFYKNNKNVAVKPVNGAVCTLSSPSNTQGPVLAPVLGKEKSQQYFPISA